MGFTGRNNVSIGSPAYDPVQSGIFTEESDEHQEQKNREVSDNEKFEIKDSDASIDNNLPETVTLLRTPDGGKCYLVGTAHFSIESQNDVSKVIQAVQPHIVVVELCNSRIHILELDEKTILEEAKNLTMSKILDLIKTNGVYKGMFYVLFLSMSAHLTKELGLAPGGEFRTAFTESKKVPNCKIHMGDRPIEITMGRALRSLTCWQLMKLAWSFLFDKEEITLKDIEKFKSSDMIKSVMGEFADEYPALTDALIKERDIFLTHSLQMACKPRIGLDGKVIPTRVVGVVGIGHSQGIVENWGKVEREQIPPIMSIPTSSPSVLCKALKYTAEASLFGAVIYVGSRFIPMPISLRAKLKSSVGSLMKIRRRK